MLFFFYIEHRYIILIPYMDFNSYICRVALKLQEIIILLLNLH